MLRRWDVFNKLPLEQVIRIKHIHVFEGGKSALYVTSGDIVFGVGVNGNYNLLGLSERTQHSSLVLEPVSVERLSLKSINTIAVGDFFGVAINANGELYHWGRRMDRKRGILLPHQVKCPHFVTDVACGNEFFIILTKELKVYFRGSFQRNDFPIVEFTEILIGDSSVSTVSSGIFHAALLTTSGEVFNCGYDHHVTYRTWKPEEGLIPKKLVFREHCVQVVCGRRSTVCLLSSGLVWACGENDNLGVESENSVMKQPARVIISEPIRELAATWNSNIYAASAWNGRIYSWGHKTRWPTPIKGASVLLDAFKNKETPPSLGSIPVAPQLSPYSSIHGKTAISHNVSNDVAQYLERSLSADDLTTSHYPPMPKETPDKKHTSRVDIPKTTKQNASKPMRPPGLGLLMTAGKYLSSRPRDKRADVNTRQRAISPEAHPSKVPKPTLSIANGTPTHSEANVPRSHSMENLDSPPSPQSKKKPRVLSMIFGLSNPFDVIKSPLASPDKENAPRIHHEQTQEIEELFEPEYMLSPTNPFSQSKGASLYPKLPPKPHARKFGEPTGNFYVDKSKKLNKGISTSNPFLYDPIEFKFHSDSQEQNTNAIPEKQPESNAYNPGTKAVLKYYCLLAEVKSDIVELQGMVNELANILADFGT